MNIQKKDKLPPEPLERYETVRREILLELKEQSLTAKDLSSAVGIPEKDVYDHLEHIRKTAVNQPCSFTMAPAVCLTCGFIFRKRERLKKPGRCPVCKRGHIQPPRLTVTTKA